MFKKILIVAIIAVLSLGAKAQWAGWYKYPIFYDKIDNLIETPDKIYFQSGNSLFSYCYDDEEMLAYTPLNKLSDNNVSSIYYNPEGKYLLVTYDNCNIDLIYDNGEVVNLPQIKDANISNGHSINDVAFGCDRIAVATTFGMVLYDANSLEVIESGIYNTDILAIALMNNRLLLYYRVDNGYGIVQAPLDMRHNTLDKFNQIGGGVYIEEMVPLNPRVLLMKGKSTGELMTRTLYFENNSWSVSNYLGYYPNKPLTLTANGVCASTDEGIALITADKTTYQAYPEQMQGQKGACWDDVATVWLGDAEGVARYDFGSGVTVLADKMLCADATTTNQVGYMRWSPDKKRLYLSNMGASLYKSFAMGERNDMYQTTNILVDSYPIDVSIHEASASSSTAKKYQEAHSNHRLYGDPLWVVEDPEIADRYYLACNYEGVYVAQKDAQTGEYKEIGKYTFDNSAIAEVEGNSRVLDVNIDPKGNLWVGFIGEPGYAILPAEKRRLSPEQVKASDWKPVSALSRIDFVTKDMISVFCDHDIVFLASGQYGGALVALYTNGAYADPSQHKAYLWNKFTDQDGISFDVNRITFLLEDLRGALWVGTTSGIFEITQPSEALSPAMTVKRIKVPRNDGTNFADYLLDSDQINWISLDPAGRKWVATENSGIFLISETGDKIIRNYTTDNSPLPTNTVCSIECDPSTNTVYVGTPMGLYTFLSDASAPQDDFSDILAYPNPVRPEYSGDVTISGLMDNSIVKIVDNAGNAVYETRSEGGMASWNVCNHAGKRVRSGVYYVYASSTNEGSKKGAVAKILVIN